MSEVNRQYTRQKSDFELVTHPKMNRIPIPKTGGQRLIITAYSNGYGFYLPEGIPVTHKNL